MTEIKIPTKRQKKQATAELKEKIAKTNKIYVEEYRLKELKEKYQATNIWEKELENKLNYYNKNPFHYHSLAIFLQTIKENVILKNPNGTSTKRSEILTEMDWDREQSNNDLKTFIFNENEIIKTGVFASSLLKKGDISFYGFGVLLPRNEDVTDKDNNVTDVVQKWRPVIITSNRRGLVISKHFKDEYKIKYETIPYNMKLRWELNDIDKFIHSKKIEKIDGKELLYEIVNLYKEYLFFRSKEWYLINAIWDIGTYYHQLMSAYPLKEERGMKSTGKTQTMLVSSLISLNATDIMINPSESTLFRLTEELRPTKYIDEAEKLFRFNKNGVEGDNRIELINASFLRSGVVPRQEKIGNNYLTKWYHVYSPTRVGSINGLYGATEDRAITQIHTKNPDNDKRGDSNPEDDINEPKWKKLRNKLYRLSLGNWSEVYEEYYNFENITKLKSRDFQIWKPLFVIAKVLDKTILNELITFAENIANQKKNENIVEGTLDYKFLNSLNQFLISSNSNKIYIEHDLKNKFKELYPFSEFPSNNKSITKRLDKLGFIELKERDNKGIFYNLNKKLFDEIISPITNDFSTQSTQSTPFLIKVEKIGDERVTNNMNIINNKIINNSVESDENVESDEHLELNRNCVNCDSSNVQKYSDIVFCNECKYKEKI